MASGSIVDPIVLLRAAPLVSSTCTLLYASDQDFFLGLLNRPGTREHSRRLLRPYFTAFFRRGVVFVVGCLAATTWSSIANLCVRRPALRARGPLAWWYAAGAVLSAGHLLFVPFVAPHIKAITSMDAAAEEDGDGAGSGSGSDRDPNASLDEWLAVNRIRMWTVDFAAWVACIVAAAGSLTA